MTNPEKNLHVLTSHIDDLARKQLEAADQITGANRSAADITSQVFATHGAACAATTAALSIAEEDRNTLGTKLLSTSNEFAAKLATAALNYQNTDYLAGRALSQECRV